MVKIGCQCSVIWMKERVVQCNNWCRLCREWWTATETWRVRPEGSCSAGSTNPSTTPSRPWVSSSSDRSSQDWERSWPRWPTPGRRGPAIHRRPKSTASVATSAVPFSCRWASFSSSADWSWCPRAESVPNLSTHAGRTQSTRPNTQTESTSTPCCCCYSI